ncbi:oligopeptide ABC transporter permease [Loigolactobacillus binensis]|uniref:Oligopeptide ABC transporter permease n=1 Tax=Loigolactobacillus binensis TaxID=2559922 RepID=A0ABW3EIF7_9LACO|nr:oligopeptide ABC transporter permease [Loigolactobacillus binensis]
MADEKMQLPKDAFEPLQATEQLNSERIAAPSLTFLQDAWRRLKKNKAAVISLWVLVVIIILAVGSIWFSPRNPNAQNAAYANLPPKIGGGFWGFDGKANIAGAVVDAYKQAGVPKGTYYILGTDYLGRDLLSRILFGTRISLLVAFVATFFDLVIGVAYGMISGWYGGRVDTIMQRVLEVISSVPNLVVVILMIVVFKPGIFSISMAIAITGWITMARLIRAQTLKMKDQEFILAARTLGESTRKIALKHLLPNLSSTIIIQLMFTIPTAIFFEAFLSFIGIGISAPNASLGTLLNDGYKTFRFLPYQMWYPAAVLSIIMIAFNLLADGLRDAFDPRTRG